MDLTALECDPTAALNGLWTFSPVMPQDLVSGSYSTSLTTNSVVGTIDLWGAQSGAKIFLSIASPTWVYANATAVYAQIQVLFKASEEVRADRISLSVSDQITYIRARLGLRVSDFAKIFRVDRQSVYGWINSSYTPTDDKIGKLEAIYFAAKLSTHYLNSAVQNICYQQVGDKGSLIAAFSDNSIDFNKIKEILKLLPGTQQEERRAKMRRSSVRDALRRQGMDDSPTQSGINEVDLVTGKIRTS